MNKNNWYAFTEIGKVGHSNVQILYNIFQTEMLYK